MCGECQNLPRSLLYMCNQLPARERVRVPVYMRPYISVSPLLLLGRHRPALPLSWASFGNAGYTFFCVRTRQPPAGFGMFAYLYLFYSLPSFRRTAAEDLAQVIPEWARFDVEEVVRLACRVNVNAHGLRDDSGSNLVVGVGMFPLAAMINHSCRPNCTFVYFGKPRGQSDL